MRNTMKVAKWEIKRNLKNKSYIIGLFLTPIIFLAIFLIGSWVGGDSDDQLVTMQVLVHDQIGVYDVLEQTAAQSGIPWEMEQTDASEADVSSLLEGSENTAYLFIDERLINDGLVPVYTSDEMPPYFMSQLQVLTASLQVVQLERFGVGEEERELIASGIRFDEQKVGEMIGEETEAGSGDLESMLRRVVPGVFAGIIMLSIVFTGMAIFTSASQEKKDKIAEIILSSVSPTELMQGKIIGYFVLGLIQVAVFIAFLLPITLWKMDFPILQYLLVPELLLFVAISIIGYLMFAAIFAGIGATMADMTTAGTFQSMALMLPFLPFFFIGPVISNPSGIVAQVTTYVPFTAPGVLLIRLTMLEQWPWTEIIISLAVLVISAWVFMKLAGKIFKVGILMYGKNATPKEIWKWIRS